MSECETEPRSGCSGMDAGTWATPGPASAGRGPRRLRTAGPERAFCTRSSRAPSAAPSMAPWSSRLSWARTKDPLVRRTRAGKYSCRRAQGVGRGAVGQVVPLGGGHALHIGGGGRAGAGDSLPWRVGGAAQLRGETSALGGRRALRSRRQRLDGGSRRPRGNVSERPDTGREWMVTVSVCNTAATAQAVHHLDGRGEV